MNKKGRNSVIGILLLAFAVVLLFSSLNSCIVGTIGSYDGIATAECFFSLSFWVKAFIAIIIGVIGGIITRN